MNETQDKATAMAEKIAAVLDPEDLHASARACAAGFNRVFCAEWGYTARIILSALASFEEGDKTEQNRL
ncbi:MAG: hypothetical protein LBQ51_05115 [Desulfovibrio sp.]|jgi:hypothetical protein|nr:hypothetical protein [Desulfovibrio sp.]